MKCETCNVNATHIKVLCPICYKEYKDRTKHDWCDQCYDQNKISVGDSQNEIK
jgi:predicted RNA-binding protein with PUA-like domain